MTQQKLLLSDERVLRESSIADRAEWFCQTTPYRHLPYSQRNWGGPLHSLCSYQGKMKPAIAHFLVSHFTRPGDVVIDPLAGVGTIPLEARRLGRVGIGNDLSPLAYSVTSAKLEPLDMQTLRSLRRALSATVRSRSADPNILSLTDVEWGLNGPIHSYYHPRTLAEIVAAREFFLHSPPQPELNLLRASVLHILHGNRPYALSRRSHPVTPLAPRGDTEYRSLVDRLALRLDRIVPLLMQLSESSQPGLAIQSDFRVLDLEPADAVISSPPFTKSVRFWRSNWLRLWFAGWERDDFHTQPPRYLETQQAKSYKPYEDLISVCAALLRTGGVLILHLGETKSDCMAENIVPLLSPAFRVHFVGRENVEGTESFGLTDQGATFAHWYIFCERVTNGQR